MATSIHSCILLTCCKFSSTYGSNNQRVWGKSLEGCKCVFALKSKLPIEMSAINKEDTNP